MAAHQVRSSSPADSKLAAKVKVARAPPTKRERDVEQSQLRFAHKGGKFAMKNAFGPECFRGLLSPKCKGIQGLFVLLRVYHWLEPCVCFARKPGEGERDRIWNRRHPLPRARWCFPVHLLRRRWRARYNTQWRVPSQCPGDGRERDTPRNRSKTREWPRHFLTDNHPTKGACARGT
jgi:hypothetical protein